MLEAKAVNFAYQRGLPVLNDIACTIGDGEFVALLGHNGSGKTTLSRLFMALLHPRSGQVLVDGEDIVNYEPADLADKIGYVFQNPDLQILEDTVFDEVAYGPRAKKLTAETIKKQVDAALAATGLSELADAYPAPAVLRSEAAVGCGFGVGAEPAYFDFGRDHQRPGRDRKRADDAVSADTERGQGHHDRPDLARYGCGAPLCQAGHCPEGRLPGLRRHADGAVWRRA